MRWTITELSATHGLKVKKNSSYKIICSKLNCFMFLNQVLEQDILGHLFVTFNWNQFLLQELLDDAEKGLYARIILVDLPKELFLNIYPVNISTLFQRCLLVDTTSRRGTTSNQRWNNILYFIAGLDNVEQRRINVVYFKVDMNNVRQRPVSQRW